MLYVGRGTKLYRTLQPIPKYYKYFSMASLASAARYCLFTWNWKPTSTAKGGK